MVSSHASISVLWVDVIRIIHDVMFINLRLHCDVIRWRGYSCVGEPDLQAGVVYFVGRLHPCGAAVVLEADT